MADLNGDIQAMIIRHVENIRNGISQNMASQGRNATGNSVKSLLVVPDVSAVGASLTGGPQWASMQYGRGPGKVPANFTEIIKQWVRAKGISLSGAGSEMQKQNRFAFLVTRKIMREGTRLYRNKGYNDIYDSLIEEEVKKLSQEAQGMLEIHVEKLNKKRWREDAK